MITTVKHKKTKKINYKVKDIQHKCLHYSDHSLLLDHEQQQIADLYRLVMITVVLSNTNNVDDDMLDEWCLYIIEMTLKLRLMNIISCHNNDIVDKHMQVVNSAVKECRDLLLLMHYKITRDFLSNWVAQLSECLAIVIILIFNNVALTDVVADMFWTVKTTERIQLVVDVTIMMWHQDDVSVSKQENREIAKSMMLWSDDISESWGKNRIEAQYVWWCYCRRRM